MLLPAVGHHDRVLRSTVAAIVTGLLASAPGGFSEWPELLVALGACVDAGADAVSQEAGLACLALMCEDAPQLMDSPVPGGGPGAGVPPANLIVPRLIALMSSPHVPCRRHAVVCLNMLMGYPPAALLNDLDAYTAG